MTNPQELKEKIEKNLLGSKVEIIDERNDGMHYKAIVKNKKFLNKSLVEQHRMVLDVLKEDFKNKNLHSLSIETKE
ncbi:BolA/IbaG family iron-sulfur metabolism protein [Candidatus Pacearchaeota archaeon]|nr:BolA/IbaG family iron-sulfur metabolism protein [Candidatus Pacearchaeota archaeon]